MELFVPLFQAFLAFSALIGLFSFAVNLIVRPLETEIKVVKDNQVRFETELIEIKQNQARFETELKEIKLKLDQILAQAKN